MKENTIVQGLPGNYFEGKNGLTYRFTILKDIAVTGAGPVPYENSLQDSIYGLYGKYKDFALYVHFPWCIEHYSYCHYYRGPILKREELEKMLAAERKHAQMFDEKIDLRSKVIRSIYFGVGRLRLFPAIYWKGPSNTMWAVTAAMTNARFAWKSAPLLSSRRRSIS